jgi:site-specific DNA-methyltransferase (adenine-specific)
LPGDLVLDPFCGSGSTLVAAQAVRRRSLGIELDPVHADTARRRLGRSP